MEELLKQKISQFSNFLLQNCNNLEKKSLINNKLKNLKFFEIIMFIQFLTLETIDKEIETFIKLFCINDTNEVREEMKKQLIYFLEVKSILNK